MNCNFDPNVCSVNCKKYSLCAYYSIQNQFIELQSQLNFIYTTITDILRKNENNDVKIELLEESFYKYICDSNDSEPIKNFKESDNEKENQ
jgi:uncharacterized ferritin-like protein (DUF455 family)